MVKMLLKMLKMNQNWLCDKNTPRKHRCRNQNALSPDLEPAKENIELDKNAGGDSGKSIRTSEAVTPGRHHGKKIEASTIKGKLIRHHSLEKTNNGILQKAKTLFRKEKSFNDAIQRLSDKNEGNSQTARYKRTHQSRKDTVKRSSRKDTEKRSRKHESKNNASPLNLPYCKIQEVIFCQLEQSPFKIKQNKTCLEEKDSYRMIDQQNKSGNERKINPQTGKNTTHLHTENMKNPHCENLKQAHDSKEVRIKRNPHTKNILSKTNCLGPYEKSIEHKNKNQPLNKKTKHGTESSEIRIENEILHKFVKEDLKQFSCELEHIFNMRFEKFLESYKQQRKKRIKEKEERTRLSKKRGQSKNSDEIISEVFKRLINDNLSRTTKISKKRNTKEIRETKQPNCEEEQGTSTSRKRLRSPEDEKPDNSPNKNASSSMEKHHYRSRKSSKKPFQEHCETEAHIRKRHHSRKKSEIHFNAHIEDSVTRVAKNENYLMFSNENKSQPNCNEHLLLSPSQETAVGTQRKHKENRKGSYPGRPRKNNLARTQLRHKSEEIFVLPPETFKKPQIQLSCTTVPILNILPKSPYVIPIRNHKENPKSSFGELAANSVPSSPKLNQENKNTLIFPPEPSSKPRRQLKSDTVTIINILPKTINGIQTKNYRDTRSSSSPRRLTKNPLSSLLKLSHGNAEIHIFPPETSRKSQRQLNCYTVPTISILPKTKDAIETKIYTEKSLQRSKLGYENEELLIVPPEILRKSQKHLKCDTVQIITIIPKISNAVPTKIHKDKRRGASSSRPGGNLKPKRADNKEYIIKPPEHFRNAQRHFKYDTVPIINIWPKTANAIQTQTNGTSNHDKYSIEKDSLENRKQSKRFQSYYKDSLANNFHEENVDTCSMVSDSYKNVYGSSEEEMYFHQLNNISEEPLKLSTVSVKHDRSSVPLPGPRESYFGKLPSCSSRLQPRDSDGNYICDEAVKLRPNKDRTKINSRNDNILSKSEVCPNKYKENQYLSVLVPDKSNCKPNKSAFRTFVDEGNLVKSFKHCQTKSEEYMEDSKENCNTHKQFIEMYETIDTILEKLHVAKLPSVKTIETAVSSAFLNKEFLNENSDNFAAIYRIIENLEDNVAENYQEPVETVDVATGSATLGSICFIKDKEKYQEKAVGTTQKTSTILPSRFKKKAHVITDDTDAKNKFQTPNQLLFKVSAVSSVKSAKNPAVQSLSETSKYKQITIRPLSHARATNSSSRAAKPQTPKSKIPTSMFSKNIQKSSNKHNQLSKETIAIKKSKSFVECKEFKKISLKKSKSEEKLNNIPRISFFASKSGVESKAANRFFTKDYSIPGEVSTYEKRKRYDRELREKMLKKNNKISKKAEEAKVQQPS